MLILRIIGALLKPRFPVELRASSARLYSSLGYNPYSNHPPRHRWELEVGLDGIDPHLWKSKAAPYITYSFDIAPGGWPDLTGSHNTAEHSGSDLWVGDTNYGPVCAQNVEVTPIEGTKVRVRLTLLFAFSEVRYRPMQKSIEFDVNYDGFVFRTPIWNEPEKVSFPNSWNVPSSSPIWNEDQVRSFVARYVNLGYYSSIVVTHEDKGTFLKAKV